MEIHVTPIYLSLFGLVIIFATIGLTVEVHTARLLSKVVKPDTRERIVRSVSLDEKDTAMNGYKIVTLGQGNWDYFVFENGQFPVSNVAAITALSNNNFHVLLYHAPNNAPNPVVVTGIPVAVPVAI
jgi:hypothetical protein